MVPDVLKSRFCIQIERLEQLERLELLEPTRLNVLNGAQRLNVLNGLNLILLRVSKTWSKIRASTITFHEHELMGASQDRLRRRYSENRLDRTVNSKVKMRPHPNVGLSRLELIEFAVAYSSCYNRPGGGRLYRLGVSPWLHQAGLLRIVSGGIFEDSEPTRARRGLRITRQKSKRSLPPCCLSRLTGPSGKSFSYKWHDRSSKAALSEVSEMRKPKRKASRLTTKSTDEEIVRWTKSHDVFDRLETGVSEVVEDHSDLDEVLREAIFQDNTAQLNMRLPPAMKAVLSKLARQRTTDATTLARIWLAERLERELKAG